MDNRNNVANFGNDNVGYNGNISNDWNFDSVNNSVNVELNNQERVSVFSGERLRDEVINTVEDQEGETETANANSIKSDNIFSNIDVVKNNKTEIVGRLIKDEIFEDRGRMGREGMNRVKTAIIDKNQNANNPNAMLSEIIALKQSIIGKRNDN